VMQRFRSSAAWFKCTQPQGLYSCHESLIIVTCGYAINLCLLHSMQDYNSTATASLGAATD
jgi:hypothetical protein